jgi:D-sedoheptulose 7-phosphate isomerase
VSAVRDAGAVRPLLESELERRREAGGRFFGERADELARLCHRMAERFARGGRLLAFGCSAPARSDVRHVAVEFVHPVIVGKRALPALGLAGDSAPVAGELELLAEPEDIVIAFGEPADGGALAAGIATARARGCLTVAFSALGAEWELEPPSEDPFIRQELVETSYHVLWELVHVFFEHRGLLEGRSEQRVHDAGASSFLYPFLGEREHDLDAVLADVRRSVMMKADEVQELRGQTLRESAESLNAAATTLRACFARGGRVLALGNGGSATDATDLVADLAAAGHAAIDLTADSAIITALANDIGPEAIFARQVIAYARAGDVLVTLSTSGNSLSVLDALAEGRRRGLESIALVGYDGGRVAADGLADHVVLSPSQHIPRIQEAQATAYHLLCRLVERG